MPMSRNRVVFFGITYRQLALVLGMYVLAALLYDGALSISQHVWSKQSLLMDFVSELPRVFLDYGTKLLLTAPFWYLLFVRLRHQPLARRVLLHVVLLPLFIIIWQVSYYAISDAVGMGRLRDSGQIWDTYIGSLFYLVQFGIFHAYAYYRDLQQQRVREAHLRELAIKSELSALKAQLNPHFLYNVFNTISASVPPEQEHTRELLAELADLFRYQLQASRSDEATVRDEVNFVRKYLDLEKARFGDRLRVRFDVPDDVLNCILPPMLLQPLVENAVRHGIASLIDGGEVRVSIRQHANRLKVAVSDTGVGMNGSDEKGAGVGLANTRLRLEKMYGTELKITANQPHGVIVTFDLPVQEKNSDIDLPQDVPNYTTAL
jgi:two-component system LytT family sensor kinase